MKLGYETRVNLLARFSLFVLSLSNLLRIILFELQTGSYRYILHSTLVQVSYPPIKTDGRRCHAPSGFESRRYRNTFSLWIHTCRERWPSFSSPRSPLWGLAMRSALFFKTWLPSEILRTLRNEARNRMHAYEGYIIVAKVVIIVGGYDLS